MKNFFWWKWLWLPGLLIALEVSSADSLRGFPIRLEGTVEVAPPVAGDLDGDGRLELAVTTLNRLVALEADGTMLPGFPVEFKKGGGIITPLTLGSVGAESNAPMAVLIYFATEDGSLWAVDGAGKTAVGFPIKLSAAPAGAPTIGDVNGDRLLELVIGTKDGKVYVVDNAGRLLSGYPASLNAPISTAITIGHFRPADPMVLFFGDEQGRLHAWLGSDKELAGFPTSAQYTMTSQPVLGDIDDDGAFEVVFGSMDFKIYAIRSDGTPASGYPVSTGYRIYSTIALADMNGDGISDIVASSGDGKLYVLTQGGKAIKGFPVTVGQRLRSSPVVGDIDGDGLQEIAVGSDRNALVVVRSDGSIYPGFPTRMDEQVLVAPLMAELNGDGLMEIAALSRSGSLEIYRMLKKGKASAPLSWPAEARDSARKGYTYPNPPRYVDLNITPNDPRAPEPLKLGYGFHDLDGETEPKTIIQWFRNGKRVAELDGAREVPASAIRKHEQWSFSLQADSNSPTFASPKVTVRNTPPGPPQIAIKPDPARTADDLTVQILQEATDVDGDKVRYSIIWLKDRALVKGLERATVPASLTAKGQRWTVVMTPNDGETSGLPARASIMISNTAPGPSVVRLEPARPTITQDIRVVIDKMGIDPDNDKVVNRYHWDVDGTPLNINDNSPVVPAGFVKKHQKLHLEAVAFDGEEEGGKAQAFAEVVNTPPSAPEVAIAPAAAKALDELKVEMVKPAGDPDRDPITYSFMWQRKNAVGSETKAPRLPVGETRKGERWLVRVTPFDGEIVGSAAMAEVAIGNIPPIPPVVEAVNPRPTVTEDLALKIIQNASDPDGDKITNEVVWLEGDREMARGQDMWRLSAGKTKKHMRYVARVIPSDDTETGPETRQGFEVQNTPPGSCRVSIEPNSPATNESLVAKIVQRSVDPDGDNLIMRYRWYMNGERIDIGSKPEHVDGSRVKRGQHWTVVATAYDGEAEGPPCSATASVHDSPPSAPEFVLTPAKPKATDSLAVAVHKPAVDPDGDKVFLRVTWTLDDKPFAAGEGLKPIPVGTLKKGQRWSVKIVASSDGELQSPEVTAETVVANSPPELPRIEILPTKPLSSDGLTCKLVAPTEDPDGDSLVHTYEWFLLSGKNSAPPAKPNVTGPVVAAQALRKGQSWMCRSRASDGELSGPESSVVVSIGNAAPSKPEVEIQPQNPTLGQVLKCAVRKEGKDPDGDPVSYRFRWTKDGVIQSFAPSTDNVPIRLTKEKDIWQCSAQATDGQLESEWGESQEAVILQVSPGVSTPGGNRM